MTPVKWKSVTGYEDIKYEKSEEGIAKSRSTAPRSATPSGRSP